MQVFVDIVVLPKTEIELDYWNASFSLAASSAVIVHIIARVDTVLR